MTVARAPRHRRRIFAAPAAIAVSTLIGLIAALAGDGIADLVSWGALAVPPAVVLWARRARRR